MTSNIPARSIHFSTILAELMDAIREYRPHMFEGFFYTSNASAFAIATDIRSGILTDPKEEWLEALNQAMEDLLAVTSSGQKSAKTLADFGITVNSILEDIEMYDNLPGQA
jgi:hypothetical protein